MTQDKQDHEVPDGALDAEPKGWPTSDRQRSETAHHERGDKPSAPKHTYGPEGGEKQK